MPLLVGQAVDDQPTQELYDALTAILESARVPRKRRMATATMVDVIVLGSAVDEATPVPMYEDVPGALESLSRVTPELDDARRAVEGFELAVEAAIAAVERIAAGDADGARNTGVAPKAESG